VQDKSCFLDQLLQSARLSDVKIGPLLSKDWILDISFIYSTDRGYAASQLLSLDVICQETSLSQISNDNKSMQACQTMVRIVNLLLQKPMTAQRESDQSS
jgi:hypothetical protein